LSSENSSRHHKTKKSPAKQKENLLKISKNSRFHLLGGGGFFNIEYPSKNGGIRY
jgi:hypothetical protein